MTSFGDFTATRPWKAIAVVLVIGFGFLVGESGTGTAVTVVGALAITAAVLELAGWLARRHGSPTQRSDGRDLG